MKRNGFGWRRTMLLSALNNTSKSTAVEAGETICPRSRANCAYSASEIMMMTGGSIELRV